MGPLERIANVISPLRMEILRSLRKEAHPEELAREFGITRQAVDKHLSILYRYGFVDKRIREGPRPMVFYRITSDGEEFLHNFEDLVEGHIMNIRKRYKDELFSLDRMLVDGEISEGEYRNKRKALSKRFEWVMEV